MAFSFRAGTNWCHDFPKLARDSGFYFNMHRTRVRVDWNRICSLNIDQVVRESDFQTVDDNVNNVIDYSLEQEYDVKILDPNFVKLFRLAQLAVEYLLYCKQYLDQSVIILKDELKMKIEENVKLRKDITSMSECIKDLKEKNKSLDLRISPQGEVHKCPYCPKSFISAMYMNAHISRRHSTSSPTPDEYKNETEKLHNEIKTLKERLNQTEKLISESNKWTETSKNVEVEKVDKAENTEESSLKVAVSKTEKPEKSSEEINKCSEDANTTMISELKLRMESDMENVQAKLTEQENFWKTKMETMESQHHVDIENLFSQLKLTQQAASRMKNEYEYKIKDLERQSLSQSEMINAQTEMLHNLSRGIQDFHSIQKTEKPKSEQTTRQNKLSSKIPEQDDISSQEISDSLLESNSDSVRQKFEQKIEDHKSTSKSVKIKNKKEEKEKKPKQKTKSSGLIDEFVNQTSKKLKSSGVTKETKTDQDSESRETCSEEQSETGSETEESETPTTETKTESEVSETVTEETITDEDQERRKKAAKRETKSAEPPAVSEDLKEDMREIFNRKMQNLGIDPDWEGIPKATFKHKSNMLRHHQSINAKKYPKYMNIRERLLLELSKKLNSRHKERNKTPMKQGLLSKVKSKAMKAFNIQQRNPKSQVVQKQITHPRRTDPQFASNRTRKMSYDEAEFRRNLTKEVPTRASDPQLHKRNPEASSSETPTKIQKHASYETIEDFIRGSRKLDVIGTRATSTPTKNTNNFMQQSYDYDNDDFASSFMSPKGKGVLKSHPGSGTLTKKKVEFDLENRRSVSAEPTRTISFGEVTEYGLEREDSVESDLNLSSVSDEKSLPRRMETLSVGNRKTTMVSDTSNLSSPMIEIEDFDRSSITNTRSPMQLRERSSRTPQAAPRNLPRSSVRKSVPDSLMSNLEADIEDILQIS